jgi:hypothetical protein
VKPARRSAKRVIVGNDEKTTQTLTVVGVSGDFPTAQMNSTREQLLLPLAQQPSQELFLIARSMPGEPPQRMTADARKRRARFRSGEPRFRND